MLEYSDCMHGKSLYPGYTYTAGVNIILAVIIGYSDWESFCTVN